MADDQLKILITQGLQALRSGAEVAARATSEIQNDASHPQLREALKSGEQHSQQWMQRIESALQEAGGQSGGQSNPIMESIHQVSAKIRQQAPDPTTRDLGIIASGQIALHYWIAGFGTLRAYAAQCGMTQTEQSMRQCLNEAKQADEQQTDLAQQIMRG